jgi:hypothetical protein
MVGIAGEILADEGACAPPIPRPLAVCATTARAGGPVAAGRVPFPPILTRPAYPGRQRGGWGPSGGVTSRTYYTLVDLVMVYAGARPLRAALQHWQACDRCCYCCADVGRPTPRYACKASDMVNEPGDHRLRGRRLLFLGGSLDC